MRSAFSRLLVLSCVLAVAAHGEDKSLSDMELAAMGKVSTVLLELGGQRGFGSAFCVNSKGFFITNQHVVKTSSGSVSFILRPGERDQKKVVAKVLKVDKKLDLALLKAEAPVSMAPIELGSDEKLYETQEVLTFGFPFGKGLALNPGDYPSISVNKGRITALRKKAGKLHRIQIDAVVNPGNSGGPVLDKKGQLLGVVVSGILGAGAVNFIIPVSHVRHFLGSPVISFTPPQITAKNKGNFLTFRATVMPSPLSPGDPDLQLIIEGLGTERRTFDMKRFKDVYSVRAVPVPNTRRSSCRIQVKYDDGVIVGNTENRTFRIGKRSIRLSDIRLLKLGTQAEVALLSGETVRGALSLLPSVTVKLGKQPVKLAMSSAREMKVFQATGEVSLTLTVVATMKGKEVGRCAVSIGGPGDEKAPVVAGGNVPVAGGARVPGVGGEAPLPRASKGRASLEELLAGNFNRPVRRGGRISYMRVLSSAGDYIGQGKRYAYTGNQMIVKPSDGKVQISVDNWRVVFSPGKGKILRVGSYPDARRHPFNDTMPGLCFSGKGRGSNTLKGKFVVWEFVRRGTTISSIAIDFVQRSEGRGPPLVGMFRYNSNFE